MNLRRRCLRNADVCDRAAEWRHADGTVRTDHMDARPGDYYGADRDRSDAGWAAVANRRGAK